MTIMNIIASKYEKIAKDLLRRYNIKVSEYLPTNQYHPRDCFDIDKRTVKVPYSKKRKSLLTFCRTCAYIINGKIKPDYYAYYLANKWAITYIRKAGLQIPLTEIKKANRLLLKKMRQFCGKGKKKSKKTGLSEEVYNKVYNAVRNLEPKPITGGKYGKKRNV